MKRITYSESVKNRALKVRRFITKILYALNIVAAFSLLLSFLAAYIPPSSFTLPAFFGLGFSFIAQINLVFMLIWLLFKKKAFFLSSALLLLNLSNLKSTYKFTGDTELKSSSIRVMSYNVRMFNVYNWEDDKDIPEKIGTTINEVAPDVICIQEYHKSKTTPNLNYKYSQTHLPNEGKNWGLATFSKHPIIKTERVTFSETGLNSFMYNDIIFKGDTIRVFNVHLASIKLGWDDYQFLNEVSADTDSEKIKRGGIQILRRINRGFENRTAQAEKVKAYIAESPYPVIVCGDFNDTPQSYAYHSINSELMDSFVESGKGFGKSYNKAFFPLRIDYILHDKNFIAKNYKTDQLPYSDHYPISTDLEIQ